MGDSAELIALPVQRGKIRQMLIADIPARRSHRIAHHAQVADGTSPAW
jgi:hypothetical protein